MTLDVSREHALDLLRRMILIRRFEEACAEAYSEQKIRGFLHLYIGEEAVAVGAMAGLDDEDDVVGAYREHAHAMLRGVSPSTAMAEMYGKATGCARGRGGSMHLFCKERRFYGGYAIVGGGLPLAVGLALGAKMKGEKRTVACFFGDGATEEGEYHESLNLASLWKLPVLFLCENNYYAMGTPLARHAANVELTQEPIAHGIASEVVDGMDVLAVEKATKRLADAVRRGEGPRFLEIRTYRFRAHSMYDPDRYRDKAEIARWRERDPVKSFSELLLAEGKITPGDVAKIEAEVGAAVARARKDAEDAPLEPVSQIETFLYAKEPS